MERHHINSDALQSIGYDPVKNILELEFHDDGGIWQYSNFTPAMLKKFLDAPSRGNFFVTRIRGKFPEKRVG